MKKIFSLMVVFMLLISMTACSSQEDEEVPGAETEDLEVQSDDPEDTSVYNLDRVFEFIVSQYPQYTKDDFEKWDIEYFDVTGNNVDEVIFTSTYGDGNLHSAMIITEEDEYREISRYIPLAKYENNMKMEDGFLVHTQKSGGPGANYYHMDLYIYGGYYLEVVKQGILLKEEAASPFEHYELTSVIEGNLKDFRITYTKKDLTTNEEKTIAIDKYQYLDDFRMEKIPVSLSNTAKSFDSIYNGANLADTARYFHDNLYHFGETERLDFAKKIFEVISEDISTFTDWGEFYYVPIEYFNKEKLQYDITYLDEPAKEALMRIKESDTYSLVMKFFSTEGSMDSGVFDVMLNSWVYQMIQPAYNLLHKEGIYHQFPILKPDIYFSADHMPVDIVTKTHIVYPNVLVNNMDDVRALEGQDTWKTAVLLMIEVIEEGSTNDHGNTTGEI